MDVELLPGAETLVASETLTWTHPGAKPVQELYFHLYPNAFSSAGTTFMKESGARFAVIPCLQGVTGALP